MRKHERNYRLRGGKCRMRLNPKEEQGFTLIEVLAAVIILSIVSLVLTSYFTNALTYSKENQNKTIMVNLARNALFYVEKQDFGAWKEYLAEHKNVGYEDSCEVPGTQSTCDYSKLADDENVLQNVLNPSINGIEYTINIMYQADLVQENTEEYLLPVMITVKNANAKNDTSKKTVLEGYITDDKIR